MDSTFILNPLVSGLDLKDAIDERLTKIEAVTNCLMATRDGYIEPSRETIYNLIWLVDDYVDEIRLLRHGSTHQQQNYVN
jgi:hypothetical protein